MTKDVSAYIGEMLECLSCKEIAQTPLLLNKCSHVYCQPCLDGMMTSQGNARVVCIECRMSHSRDEIRKSPVMHDLLYGYNQFEVMDPVGNLSKMEEHRKSVDLKLDFIARTKGVVEEKKTYLWKQYSDRKKELDETLQKRIAELLAENQRRKDELAEHEKVQIKYLDDVQLGLNKKKSELSLLKQWIQKSVEKAHNNDLFVYDGVLLEKLDKVNAEKSLFLELEIEKPELVLNNPAWDNLVGQGLLGKVGCKSTTVFVRDGLAVKCVKNAGGRYWEGDFKQVFGKTWNETRRIELPGYCPRLTVSNDVIWAPICDKKKIYLYNKYGTFQKSIDIDGKPMCVVKSASGEMVVCCGDTGLFVRSEESGRLVNIDRGYYSDMCVYADKVYGWEYKNKQIVEFVRGHTGWKRQRLVNVQGVGEASARDTLLVRRCEGESTGIEFFIGLCSQDTILRVTDGGQQVTQYGGCSGQGKTSLSRPRICRLDGQGQLLIADGVHRQYKVLNTETGEFSTVFNRDGLVYDAKIQDEHTIWLSGESGGNHVITKHEG